MSANIEAQAARAVMMIRPANFASNPETSSSNVFQREAATPLDSLQGTKLAARALEECDALALEIAAAGVHVHLYEDAKEPQKPDSVFPNNWISTHADGTVVLYPMLAPNRRLERRPEVIESLVAEGGYRSSKVLDLSHHEVAGQFLEGTGSLVLDRPNRLAYAARSARTCKTPLTDFARSMGYRVIEFGASDADGVPYYHTNVMLSIGSHFALYCPEAVAAAAEREQLTRELGASGRELISISREQVAQFAGNVLELQDSSGQPLIVMSQRARRAFSATQLEQFESHGRILCCALDTVEDTGGGSARCMLCEIHLPNDSI